TVSSNLASLMARAHLATNHRRDRRATPPRGPGRVARDKTRDQGLARAPEGPPPLAPTIDRNPDRPKFRAPRCVTDEPPPAARGGPARKCGDMASSRDRRICYALNLLTLHDAATMFGRGARWRRHARLDVRVHRLSGVVRDAVYQYIFRAFTQMP